MKCPKCGYLGFEEVERCRNCGYDFSLSSASTLPDLSLRSGQNESERPLEDFTLLKAFERGGSNPRGDARAAGPQSSAVRTGTTPELPLFQSADGDDLPLLITPSAPRTPLAVRRATAEVPRVRGSARATMLDGAAIDSERAARSVAASVAPSAGTHGATASVASAPVPAGVFARVVAAAIDLAVLAAIDAAVVYLTLRISGLTLADFSILPLIPLAAFLVAQNLSYFVAFTTGGQTLGQMVMAVKVASIDTGRSPNVGQSVVRTLVWVCLVVPAGVGLLSALFGDERRGLHDRLAGTRVVRASNA
jgi:uncharacterized RDD family membrane protein YckC